MLSNASSATLPAPQSTSVVFEENQGQAAAEWAILSRGPNFSAAIKSTQFALNFVPLNAADAVHDSNLPATSSKQAVLLWTLLDANENAAVSGLDPIDGVHNYFVSRDATTWTTGLTRYAKAVASNVYDGIDIVYQEDDGRLRFDFRVAAQANVHQIRMQLHGAKAITLDQHGVLQITTSAGQIVQRPPKVFQMINNESVAVDGRYVMHSDNIVAFEIDNYHKDRALIIDPTVEYASYLGGRYREAVTAVKQLSDGTTLVAGVTTSVDFPTAMAIQSELLTPTFTDMFVSKLSADGNSLIFSTYLGGNDDDSLMSLSVDLEGDLIVSGRTKSSDFPLVSAFDSVLSSFSNGDGFIAKISSDGAGLVYSSYIGSFVVGAPRDEKTGTLIDPVTNEVIFVSTAQIDANVAGDDAVCMSGELEPRIENQPAVFVSKIDDAGALIRSVCIGGYRQYSSGDIAINPAGDTLAIVGKTFVTGNLVTGSVLGGDTCGADVFITTLDTDLTQIIDTACIDTDDAGFRLEDVKFDSSGRVVTVGITRSTSFPTTEGVFQPTFDHFDPGNVSPSYNAVLFALETDLSDFVFSTYLGGANEDYAKKILLDPQDRIYVVGNTTSYNFPIVNSLQNEKGTELSVPVMLTQPTALVGNAIAHASAPTFFDQRVAAVARSGPNGEGATNLLVYTQNLTAQVEQVELDTVASDTYAIAFSPLITSLDQNSNTDLITGNCNDVNRVYLGDGVGGFTLFSEFSDAQTCTQALAILDVNRDFLLDVVVSDGVGLVYHLGDGNGNFGAAVAMPGSNNSPRVLLASDVNDVFFKEELIVGNYTGFDEIYFFDNNQITFQPLTVLGNKKTTTIVPELFGINAKQDLMFGYEGAAPVLFLTSTQIPGPAPITIGVDPLAHTTSISAASFGNFFTKQVVTWDLQTDGSTVANFHMFDRVNQTFETVTASSVSMGSGEFIGSSNGGSENELSGLVTLRKQDASLHRQQHGSRDSFVTVFAPDGSDVLFSTYLGGDADDDNAGGLDLPSTGRIVLGINTESTDRPIVNGLQSINAGFSDAYLTKINLNDILDNDGDGILNNDDNCLNVVNVTQFDGDNDGYGNDCDADFNQDFIVNFIDLFIFQGDFLTLGDPATDINGDGITNFIDLARFQPLFLLPPGPSFIDL